MNALVAGSGSYIVWLSVRDLHGPTETIGIHGKTTLTEPATIVVSRDI